MIAMQTRPFGRSGLTLSVLGFGCGAVGGLMVKGSASDQERAIARAIDAGINYFDTAAQYGDGRSETNLGRVVRQLKLRDITIGTKVRLPSTKNIRATIVASLDNSLQRLGLAQVDIFHLHNAIATGGTDTALTADQVLNEVVPTFEALRQQGKIRFCGITAVGDSAAIRTVAQTQMINSAQVVFNLLNPSSAAPVAKKYPGQNFEELLKVNAACGIGSIAIRILGGGALSGSAARQPNASPAPAPIGSSPSFDGDLTLAQKFTPLVADGSVGSLTELAVRYAIAEPNVGTALIGLASQADLDTAIASVEKGPLPHEILSRVAAIQQTFGAR
jgi:L-galactose dehydrogenase/L-glyceraldehyde 3-phosphate reductase